MFIKNDNVLVTFQPYILICSMKMDHNILSFNVAWQWLYPVFV